MQREINSYLNAVEQGNVLIGKTQTEIKKLKNTAKEDIYKRMSNKILKKVKELKIKEKNLISEYQNINSYYSEKNYDYQNESDYNFDNSLYPNIESSISNINNINLIHQPNAAENKNTFSQPNNSDSDFGNINSKQHSTTEDVKNLFFLSDNDNKNEPYYYEWNDNYTDVLDSIYDESKNNNITLGQNMAIGDVEDLLSIIDVEKEHDLFYCEWSDNYKEALNLIYDEPNRDIQKSLTILESEGIDGNVLALYDTGKIYEQYLETIDMEKSYSYYKDALAGFLYIDDTNKSNAYIEYRIAKMFDYGKGVEKDLNQAIKYYKRSCEGKNKYALYNLGKLYLYDKVKDGADHLSEAYNLIRKSSQEGNVFASFELGKMYTYGSGVEIDSNKAYEYFNKAFHGFAKILEKNENDDLLYRVGKMLYVGQGIEANSDESLKYLEKSALLNNINANLMCADIYLKLGDDEHIKKSFVILNKLSDLDNDTAQYSLGKIYLTQENKEYYDVNKGIAFLTKSSLQGNSFAQLQLGITYLYNKHGVKNEELGMEWLKKSYENGNEFAKKCIDQYNSYQSSSVSGVYSMIKQIFNQLEKQKAEEKDNVNRHLTSKQAKKEKSMKNKIQGHDIEL